MRWYKIASMNVYIDGFRAPEEKYTILDLCHYVFRHALEPLFNTFSEEEQQYWRSSYGSLDNISPDGDDAFEKTGIINFYTRGLSDQRIQQLLPLFEKSLQDIGVQTGPVTQTPYEAGRMPEGARSKTRVYRIPVLGNPNDQSKLDIPPDLNMANVNAHHIFEKVLRYPAGQGGWSMPAQDLLNRVNYHMGSQSLPENHNKNPMQIYDPSEELDDWQKVPNELGLPTRSYDPEKDDLGEVGKAFQGMFDSGAMKSGMETDDIKQRLMVIKQICEWALKHGYKEIYIG